MDTWMEEQHAILTLAGQEAAWLCMVGCGLPVTAGAVTAGEDRRRDVALSRRSAGDYHLTGGWNSDPTLMVVWSMPSKLTALLMVKLM